MESDIAAAIREREVSIVPQVIARVREVSPAHAFAIDLEENRRRVKITLAAFMRSLSEDPEAYSDFWRTWSRARSTAGVPLEHMQHVQRSAVAAARDAPFSGGVEEALCSLTNQGAASAPERPC